MSEGNKKNSHKWLIMALVVVLVVVIGMAVYLAKFNNPTKAPAVQSPEIQTPLKENPGEDQESFEEEAPGIPLATDYIILSYPAELEDEVTVAYEYLADGQQIIFTTNFTGEALELFRFSISKTATDGYLLGTLKDETAGELQVCMDVYDHSNGNLAPEKFAQLNAMQERVNDIIVQFYDDSRFIPSR